jgi:hypothetical protein
LLIVSALGVLQTGAARAVDMPTRTTTTSTVYDAPGDSAQLTQRNRTAEQAADPSSSRPGAVDPAKPVWFSASGTAAKSGSSSFGNLTHAAEGIKPYSQLSKVTAGQGGKIQAHHLVERRFSDVLGGNTNDWASVVLTRGEHQVFTNAWRQAIPYGPEGTGTATRAQVEGAARQIYADYPEFLQALGL